MGGELALEGRELIQGGRELVQGGGELTKRGGELTEREKERNSWRGTLKNGELQNRPAGIFGKPGIAICSL